MPERERIDQSPAAGADTRDAGSLQAYIARVIWLCMTPLLLLAAYLSFDDVTEVRHDLDEKALGLAKAAIGAVDKDLHDRLIALQMLASSPLVDDPARWNELYADAVRFRDLFGTNVVFSDRSRRMLWNTRVPFGQALPPLPTPQGRAAAPLAFATGKPVVGDTFIGPVAKVRMVALAIPAVRDGQADHVMLATFESRLFDTQLSQVQLPSGWSLTLKDGQGTALTSRGAAGSGMPDAASADQARFSAPSAESAWSAEIAIPAAAYRAPLLEAALVLGLAILGATAAGYVGGRLASRRLGTLLRSMVQANAPTASRRDMAEFAQVRRLLHEAATEREATEATLRQSEQRFRRIFEDAPLPQAIISPTGVLTGINARFIQTFGYTLDEIPTMEAWWARAYPNETYRADMAADWAVAIEGGHVPPPSERQVTCKDGTVRDMLASGIRIDDDFLSTFVDLTDRKRAEVAVRESAELYQRTLDGMLEGCQIIGFDWRYLYVNEAAARQHGRPRESLLGKTMGQCYPGFEHTPACALLAECMERRVALHREVDFVFPDGRTASFDAHVQPAPEGIVLFSVDITGRRQVEEVQRRLAAIVESSDDAIIGKTLDGIITSWNRGAQNVFGYTAAEAVGRPLTMLIPEDRAEEEPAILARIASGESVEHFETVRVRKDGRQVDIAATISPIRDAQGRVLGASKIARDITDRKATERHLQAQLERLRLLDQITAAIGDRQEIESIHEVVLGTLEERLPVDFALVAEHDGDGSLRVLRIGPRSQALAGRAGLAEGQDIAIDADGLASCLAGDLVHEPDIASIRAAFPERLSAAGLRSLVMAPLRSESRVFGVLVVARADAGTFSSGECEFLRQLSAHVALAAEQARLYGALQGAYDELRSTQQAVMQHDRLNAMGQMASGIAHDINNAIAPVLLYSESLLEREAALSEQGRGYLRTIARAAEDVAATVARMREFYRQPEPQLSMMPVELNAMLEQVTQLTRARWSDMPQQQGMVVRLVAEPAADLPAIRGVESEVREALTNLVFNAVDAMPQGGTLTLRTSRVESPAGGTAASVLLEVVDTGIGMDEETRRHCFEPFFTTKGERGTGLGLAMVYGFAQRHHADIDIQSTLGQGTAVRLVFPALRQSADVGASEDEVGRRPAAPLRILVVDDDPVVREAVQEGLRADGHDVVAAEGGREGIAEFRRLRDSGAGVDVVITDLGMPHVDGRQVAEAVKQADPTVPVVLLTGWGRRLVADGDIPPHVDRVLSKPPKLRDLRTVLADLCTTSPETPR